MSERSLKKIPSVVQLPGGIKLNAVRFKVTAYNEDGSPKTFEIMPAGEQGTGRGIWHLFADEQAIRAIVPEEQR